VSRRPEAASLVIGAFLMPDGKKHLADLQDAVREIVTSLHAASRRASRR
jgi:hypothetical protein